MLSLCEEYVRAFNFGTPLPLGHTFSVPSLSGQIVLSPTHPRLSPLCCCGSRCLQPLRGPTALSPAGKPFCWLSLCEERILQKGPSASEVLHSDAVIKTVMWQQLPSQMKENASLCFHRAGGKLPVSERQRKPFSPFPQTGNIHPVALSTGERDLAPGW